MKRLVQVALAMGTFSVVNVVIGFVRSKYSALALGPDGVGFLSQASGFLLLAITVCTINSGTGIVKRLAEALDAHDRPRALSLVHTMFGVLCLAGGGAGLVLAAWAAPAARLLFGDARYAVPLLGVAAATPLDVLAAGLFQPIILGCDRYDLYTRASIVATVLAVVPFLVLTWQWGLPGAMVSIGAGAAVRFVVFFAYSRRALEWRPRLSVSAAALRSVIGYGAAMLLVAALLEATAVVIRTTILRRLGPGANGVFQVPVALSSYYSVFFTNALWGHFYPRTSRSVSPEERRSEVEAALRFVTLGFTLMAAVLLAVKAPLIVALYSSQFGAAAPLLLPYVVGDLLFLLAMVYTVSLLSLPRLGFYVVAWVGFCAVRAALSLAAIVTWGLVGAAAAYLAASAVILLACAAYHATRLSLRPSRGMLRLLVGAVGVLVLPSALPATELVRGIAQLLLAGTWLLLTVTREERAMMTAFIARRLGWQAAS
ncbi:MAG: polysaccharide biosynthesis C-terminal domain-containing protein [Candidatus Rokubacteria bacterium]|nr:polysaccharide biosynthesis C-terminal domain-containing protein [Candidatus Rokubacteria bacterium]